MTHRLLQFLFVGVMLLKADSVLEGLKSEPNAEKRSERALDLADQALDRARDANKKGDSATLKAALEQLRECSEFARDTLFDTGKSARRNPKYFKRAEQHIHQLERRLDTLAGDAGVDDKPAVKDVHKSLEAVREDLVNGIMSKPQKH